MSFDRKEGLYSLFDERYDRDTTIKFVSGGVITVSDPDGDRSRRSSQQSLDDENDGAVEYTAVMVKQALQDKSREIGVEIFDGCEVHHMLDFLKKYLPAPKQFKNHTR